MLDPVELALVQEIKYEVLDMHRQLSEVRDILRYHSDALETISKNTHDSNIILNEEVTKQEPDKWWKKPFGLF